MCLQTHFIHISLILMMDIYDLSYQPKKMDTYIFVSGETIKMQFIINCKNVFYCFIFIRVVYYDYIFNYIIKSIVLFE